MSSYKIFGFELSPYSVKVRSWFRYKGLDHEWIVRDFEHLPEFKKYARLPIVPLVVTPEKKGVQDSTPLMEKFEKECPGPTMIPDDPFLAFLSRLLEEYGDEWVNKPLFHYRWNYEEDRKAASKIIATYFIPQKVLKIPLLGSIAVFCFSFYVSNRQRGRHHYLGTNLVNAPVIEDSFLRLIKLLDLHLVDRPYIFGGKPAQADFGLWGQLYSLSLDPTPRALMESHSKNVLQWIKRMLSPKDEGDFETLETLSPTLGPLLKEEVAEIFLPWAHVNLIASAGEKDRFSIRLKGKFFEQKPIKYQAKSFKILLDLYKNLNEDEKSKLVLEKMGLLVYLK
jgi:glutathione S-transferase